MDFIAWKRYKRSGTYRRDVPKRYEQSVLLAADSNEIIYNRHSQVKEGCPGNGSVQNFVSENLQLEQKESDKESSNDSNDSDSSVYLDSSDIKEKNTKLCVDLQYWAVKFNITHDALIELTLLLNNRIPNSLPKNPRTLLNTPTNITILPMASGHYYHSDIPENKISLNMNIDGLPAFKSSKLQLWPILCNIYEIPKIPPHNNWNLFWI